MIIIGRFECSSNFIFWINFIYIGAGWLNFNVMYIFNSIIMVDEFSPRKHRWREMWRSIDEGTETGEQRARTSVVKMLNKFGTDMSHCYSFVCMIHNQVVISYIISFNSTFGSHCHCSGYTLMECEVCFAGMLAEQKSNYVALDECYCCCCINLEIHIPFLSLTSYQNLLKRDYYWFHMHCTFSGIGMWTQK